MFSAKKKKREESVKRRIKKMVTILEKKIYTQISNGILAPKELLDVYEIRLEHGLPVSIQHWPASPTDSLDQRNLSYK